MTQDALADRVTFSKRTLVRYEKDETDPGPAEVTELAIAIGVRPEWLATGEGPREPKPSQDAGIPRAHVELPDRPPPPPIYRVPIAEIYADDGRHIGTRYRVDEIHTTPYAIVIHPDGRESTREVEPTASEG